ncbi:MAG: hypothetical protein VKJ06_03585 [Vampirovibrionales bacterium]|nr:hypothetical protein [Vampirovibrionales bacterium]
MQQRPYAQQPKFSGYASLKDLEIWLPRHTLPAVKKLFQLVRNGEFPGMVKRYFEDKDKRMLFLSGLVYVPSTLINPLVTYFQLKKEGVNQEQVKIQTKLEMVRSGLSNIINAVTHYGPIAIAELINLTRSESTKIKTMDQFFTSVALTTLGYGLLRPAILNKYAAKNVLNEHLVQSQMPAIQQQGYTQPLSNPALNLPGIKAGIPFKTPFANQALTGAQGFGVAPLPGLLPISTAIGGLANVNRPPVLPLALPAMMPPQAEIR